MPFLARDIPYRLRHFDHLELVRDWDSGEPRATRLEVGRLLRSLFLLLARAGSLRSLTIEQVECILDLDDVDLAGAMSMVGTLKSIYMTDIGELGAKMLKESRSALDTVDISTDLYNDDTSDEDEVDDGEDEEEEEEEAYDGETTPPRLDSSKLTHALRGSRKSLHSLTTYGCRWTHDGPRYPLLVYLVIAAIDKPRTRDYVYISSNLRRLSTFDCNDMDNGFSSTLGAYEQLRSKNQREQARYGTWSSLWQYDGPLSTLFALAPMCRIYSLDLVLEESEPDGVGMLRSCVDDAWPRHMHLLSHSARWLFNADFLATWTRPTLQSLLHLQLVFSLRPKHRNEEEADPPMDFSRALDNVVIYIVSAMHSLRSFSLSLNAAPYTSPKPPVATYPLGALEQALEEWDMDAFARRVRAAGASGPLQFVALHISKHRTRAEETVLLGPVYALPGLKASEEVLQSTYGH